MPRRGGETYESERCVIHTSPKLGGRTHYKKEHMGEAPRVGSTKASGELTERGPMGGCLCWLSECSVMSVF